MKATIEKKQQLVEDFLHDYQEGVTIVERKVPEARARKVNVYVDGILTTLPEDALERLIDIGFLIVVTKRP